MGAREPCQVHASSEPIFDLGFTIYERLEVRGLNWCQSGHLLPGFEQLCRFLPDSRWTPVLWQARR